MATYRNRPAYAGAGLGARFALARAITTVASLVAAIIVLAIVLHHGNQLGAGGDRLPLRRPLDRPRDRSLTERAAAPARRLGSARNGNRKADPDRWLPA
jgi:hypothetical protein